MKISGILYDSLANGPGIRYVLFTQGCTMRCNGCQNKHTWNINDGLEMSVKDIIKNIENNNQFIEGITLSGGDPIEQPEEIALLIKSIRDKWNDKFTIMLYTGRTYEYLLGKSDENIKYILENIDILVDSKFEENNMTGAPKYAGSANQRVIYLKR